jgi:hypothetical protein
MSKKNKHKKRQKNQNPPNAIANRGNQTENREQGASPPVQGAAVGSGSEVNGAARNERPPSSGRVGLGERFTNWLFGISWPFLAMLGVILIVGNAAWEAHHHGRVGEAFWANVCNIVFTTLAELGIALIVFSLVSITIERFARERSEEEHKQRMTGITDTHKQNLLEIEKHVFKHILKFVMDDKVVDEYLISMTNSFVVRKGLELRYEFASVSNPDVPGPKEDLLAVTVTVQYELHLMAGDFDKIPLHHYFENVLCRDGSFDRMLDFSAAGCDLPREFHERGWRSFLDNDGIRRGIKIPEVIIRYGTPARIKYRYRVLRRYSDSETYVTTLPADGLKVTVVTVDPKIPRLKFLPDAAHRRYFKWDEEPSDAQSQTLIGSIRCGFLPHQGFMLFWCPQHLVDRMHHA